MRTRLSVNRVAENASLYGDAPRLQLCCDYGGAKPRNNPREMQMHGGLGGLAWSSVQNFLT